ncbi:MAG: protein kinase [Deltaproteobacteria bacterium]|nr:protein kinase [Deltaproteobacteria bacterium]
MRAWSPPPTFEEYSLVRALGHGEMGEVYLAHDNLLDRPVAAKFIASLKQDGHQRTRFMIEARAAARIQHPNVVAVYRVGEIDAHPFLISEFMRGIRLDELETPVPASRALDIAIGLARGLSAAHRKGVLHRDIKPANAMLSEEGIPKLLDFGLAKVTAPSEVEVTADLAETTEVIDAGELLAEALSSSDGAPRASLPPAPTIPPGAPISPSTSAESLLRDLPTRKITREGTIMGTPDYMAPEVWRGEPATMQSDVYSLGAVIFELCAGRTVFAGVAPARLPAHVNEVDPPSLISVAPGTDRRLAEIVDRALRREPTERFLDGEALCAALEALQTTVTPLPMDGPYRGLQPFDANHRAIFLGRESEVRDAMDRLRGGSFLVLAGEAAIGKSSLCRAGIIPLAEELGFEDGRVYKTLQMPPTARPATTAAGLLATALGLPEAAVLDTLRFSPGDLAPLLSQALGEDRGLFWVIDPLDGLLARADSAERDQFEELLARAIALVPGVRVLGVARTENLSRLASLPMLGPHFSRSLYVLRAPSRESLRRVVVEPAERWGVRFESPALVEALVEQAANLPAGLAMLEWVLSTLWEARDEKCGTIRAAALEAMGGVSGAIATHAESVIQALPPNEVANAKQILVRLVDAQGARVRRGQAELGVISEGKEVVLERLLSGGIVTAIAEGAEPSYELSHDLLLRRWPTLRRWLSDDEEIRAVIDRIGRSAGEWLRLGRPRDALWARRQLEEARQIPRAKLQPLEQQFLAASFAAVGRARLLRACLVGSGLLAVVGAYTIAELAAQKRRVAQIASHEQSADLALSRAEAAHKTAGELRLQAIRAFEDGSREPGERAFLEYEGAQHAEDLELRSALGSVETAKPSPSRTPASPGDWARSSTRGLSWPKSRGTRSSRMSWSPASRSTIRPARSASDGGVREACSGTPGPPFSRPASSDGSRSWVGSLGRLLFTPSRPSSWRPASIGCGSRPVRWCRSWCRGVSRPSSSWAASHRLRRASSRWSPGASSSALPPTSLRAGRSSTRCRRTLASSQHFRSRDTRSPTASGSRSWRGCPGRCECSTLRARRENAERRAPFR